MLVGFIPRRSWVRFPVVTKMGIKKLMIYLSMATLYVVSLIYKYFVIFMVLFVQLNVSLYLIFKFHFIFVIVWMTFPFFFNLIFLTIEEK